MKNKVIAYVFAVLFAVALFPVINSIKYIRNNAIVAEKWLNIPTLYNFDFALSFLEKILYPLGISLSPNQVIIGKEDWLFLGDSYTNTFTAHRRGASENDAISAKKIAYATEAWDKWLKSKGVKCFKLILGPNKSTVYPEFLPNWAQPSIRSSTDTLIADINRTLYVDTRPVLIAAKNQFSATLYYKTDTHWNNLGAWLAFRTLAKEISLTEIGLNWLSDQQVQIINIDSRQGGDLARFLRIEDSLKDSEVNIGITSNAPIETQQYDYATGILKVSGGNPQIASPKKPLLVKSSHALNQKKVLWIRDSFGVAMSPYMATTFSETLQIHYNSLESEQFSHLVDSYKPDYVFITIVERDALDKWFETPPPSSL